ncbi:hypothetical protein [Vibrio scophthalmi]|uniref:Uncharacterized protein n=1 Tax=Vibrio scophthalmi TaxID=45658 RepID=A0A1C7F979_9VIBR|nr:hypothetical protein [Vibrio scophthalmi]ANU36278.1 hypothetical protein VSVS05_01151 [Vibrio scophthalmi]
MDTSGLIIQYSQGDFAQAIRQLLPKGEYWQQLENTELTNVISAMAQDFKTTHDEIELSLLTEFGGHSFGWKLRDYQGLLNTVVGSGSGVVTDNPSSPNLLCTHLNDQGRTYCQQAWHAFEEKRLPHTDINWVFQSRTLYHHQLANYRHIRNRHIYEVTQ